MEAPPPAKSSSDWVMELSSGLTSAPVTGGGDSLFGPTPGFDTNWTQFGGPVPAAGAGARVGADCAATAPAIGSTAKWESFEPMRKLQPGSPMGLFIPTPPASVAAAAGT